MRSGPLGHQSLPHDRTDDSVATHVVDDFEEDTLLPPPAPGMVSPAAEHLFDPPTWPGIGAPLRTGPQAALRAANAGVPMARMPPSGQPLPPSAQSPSPLPEPLYLPPVTAVGAGESDDTRQVVLSHFPPAAEATTADVLPVLPMAPHSSSATALLSYLFQVGIGGWQRDRLARRAAEGLRAEVETLDRLLVDLGQYAYVATVDLLSLYPVEAVATESAADDGSPEALRRRAERFSARIDAEQLRSLALLGREEARLLSELLHCLAMRRDPLLFDEPAVREEFDLLLPRLAAVRLERWVQERARAHCLAHPQQLLLTLESLLLSSPRLSGQAAMMRLRPPPNLRLLGALLSGQRWQATQRLTEPWLAVRLGSVPGRPPGSPLSPILFQPIWQFLDRLLPRATLVARASVERQGYDREAVRRALLLIAVVLGTVGVCAAIAVWALFGG